MASVQFYRRQKLLHMIVLSMETCFSIVHHRWFRRKIWSEVNSCLLKYENEFCVNEKKILMIVGATFGPYLYVWTREYCFLLKSIYSFGHNPSSNANERELQKSLYHTTHSRAANYLYEHQWNKRTRESTWTLTLGKAASKQTG